MKAWWQKTIVSLAAENRQDDELLQKNVADVCDWAERINEKFNILNYYDRQRVIDQATDLAKKGNKKGRLYGVPLVIKDNISISGWPTTAASKILKGYQAPYDATVIGRLSREGAIIIGRANMDEFAMGSSGENSADGFSRNPWDSERVPGGSSSGSAIAAATGLGMGALGSDTGGSIRLPASFCGVVGLKPTYGRVSRYGLLALGSSLDQIGPLTRRVEDAGEMLTVMAGWDERDSSTEDVEVDDYAASIDSLDKGLKVALVEEMYEQADSGVKQVMDETIARLESKNIKVEKINLPMLEHSVPVYYIIQSSECSANLARYDGIKYGYEAESDNEIANLLELYTKTRQVGFGDEVKRRIMLGTYSLSSGYYDDYFQKAAQVRTKIVEEFNRLFDQYDVLLGLTAPSVAFRIGEKVDDPLSMYLTDIMTISVSLAGLPALSVPAGMSEGMPVGIQLIGPMWSEKRLLQLGYLLEKECGWDQTIPTEIKAIMEE